MNWIIKKAYDKAIGNRIAEYRYQKWFDEEMSREKNEKQMQFEIAPFYSIVVPLYHTPERYLRDLIESVRIQSYSNWELIFSDGSGGPSAICEVQKDYEDDPRIIWIKNDRMLNISENTNCALSAAKGDYIVFADHDDVLAPYALWECTKAVNNYSQPDLIYSDEDKISMDGKKHFQPHFKPDFNLYLLRSMNYFCHLVVVKKTLQKKVGLLDERYNGAQDYDFVLRCVEQANGICHISKVLYHWRAHQGSIAGKGESKEYAFEAGRQALLAHYHRCGIQADVRKGEIFGLYHTRYSIMQKPLVSVITDNIDKSKLVLQNAGYSNYEILSEQKFSEANGDFYLFLRACSRSESNGWLEEMMSLAMQPQVGIVGVHLYRSDGRQAHAGVIIGGKRLISDVGWGERGKEIGYFGRYNCVQEYSAVEGYCLLISKECLEKSGGWQIKDELKDRLKYINLCLKAREQKYLIVYDSNVKIRCDSNFEELSKQEGKVFGKRWESLLRQGDPYYNSNLSVERKLYRLK